MYVSIRDCYVASDDFATPVEGLKILGVNAVEIELTPDFEVYQMDSKAKIKLNSVADAEAYKKHLDSLNIKATAFLTYRDFSVGDMPSHIAWVTKSLELAEAIGMPAVRIDSHMDLERSLTFDKRVDLFVEALGGALKNTDGAKVAMGIENHGYQGNSLAFLLNIFKKIGSDRIGSTMDTGNFYWRGYPLSEVYGILYLLAPHAKHTHLKNIKYPAELRETMREGGWEYGTYVDSIEGGDIDHARVIKLLNEAGYAEDICIEDESLEKYSTAEERIALLKRDIDYVKGIIAAL